MTDNIKAMIEAGDNYCKKFLHECTPDSVGCLKCFATSLDSLGYCIPRPEADIKAEAVKEFAEKLIQVIEYHEEISGRYDPQGTPIYICDSAIIKVEAEKLSAQEDAKCLKP